MLSPMGDESKTTRFSGGLLFVYSQNKKTKPVESCLLKLNDIARKKKTRLVYYDNHSLKEDLSQFIVEEYRLSKMEQK